MDMDFETFKKEFIAHLDNEKEKETVKLYIFQTEDKEILRNYKLDNKVFKAENNTELFKNLYLYLLKNCEFDLILKLYKDAKADIKENAQNLDAEDDAEYYEKLYSIEGFMSSFSDFECTALGTVLWFEEVTFV